MTALVESARPKGARAVSTPRWGADEAVTQMYAAHYTSLVRLASLLVHGSGEAEEIVQDAFVAMHDRWRHLREPDRALAYVRQAVVNRARSALRHHVVVDKHLPREVDDSASAEHEALAAGTRRAVLNGVQLLPARQREVLVLRYFADLSESEIAAALGISRGSVKTHASRGLSTLRTTLETQR